MSSAPYHSHSAETVSISLNPAPIYGQRTTEKQLICKRVFKDPTIKQMEAMNRFANGTEGRPTYLLWKVLQSRQGLI